MSENLKKKQQALDKTSEFLNFMTKNSECFPQQTLEGLVIAKMDLEKEIQELKDYLNNPILPNQGDVQPNSENWIDKLKTTVSKVDGKPSDPQQ